MKIFATICEYNPFHLGHLKHIDYIKNTLKADKLIVIMSGNFTQRGEPAIMDKFTRAKHCILAGADMVIELPTVFATANAEIFAKGAIGIITSLHAVNGICFGIESGTKEDYINLATALNDESKEFKKALKEQLDSGVSLAKAKFLAVKSLHTEELKEELINSPNNVLGLEYVKALLKLKSEIDIYPMIREGDHNDTTLKKGITSATSIRTAIKSGNKKKIKKCVPPFVFKDIPEYPYAFENMILAKAMTESAENMSKILDCTEGLENRIKALVKSNRTLESFIQKATTKRYTATRIQRILIANLLEIKESLVIDGLNNNFYAKVLAVNENSKELLSIIKQTSSIPVLVRKSDNTALKKTASACYEIDALASDLYNLATNSNINENQTLFI